MTAVAVDVSEPRNSESPVTSDITADRVARALDRAAAALPHALAQVQREPSNPANWYLLGIGCYWSLGAARPARWAITQGMALPHQTPLLRRARAEAEQVLATIQRYAGADDASPRPLDGDPSGSGEPGGVPGEIEGLSYRALHLLSRGDRAGFDRIAAAIVTLAAGNADDRFARSGIRARLDDLVGAYQDALALFECRDYVAARRAALRAGHPDPAPTWNGDPLGDRTLLVRSMRCGRQTQGYGDVLQACRYLPHLVDPRGRVLVAPPRALRDLLRDSLPPAIGIVDEGARTDVAGDWAQLPALGADTTEGSPYLRASMSGPVLPDFDPRRPSGPRRRRGSALRVGLTWATGGDGITGRLGRSVPFPALAPLFDLPDVVFYSLQVGSRTSTCDGSIVHRLDSLITTFSETASLMVQMDVVVSCDGGNAHLAGALGVPCFTLVPYVADARWGHLDRDDTDLYRTMRLVRQPTPGDWTSVANRVAQLLESREAPAAALSHTITEVIMTSKPSSAGQALRDGSTPPTLRPVKNVPGGPLDRTAPTTVPVQSGTAQRPPLHDGDVAPPQGDPNLEVADSPVPLPRIRDETGVPPRQPGTAGGGF